MKPSLAVYITAGSSHLRWCAERLLQIFSRVGHETLRVGEKSWRQGMVRWYLIAAFHSFGILDHDQGKRGMSRVRLVRGLGWAVRL
jgi:hypothetical protein